MAAAEVGQRRASERQQRIACVILSEALSRQSVINDITTRTIVRLKAISSIHTMFPSLLFMCDVLFHGTT